jgi:predicted MPP superfamily phosphohydrolase
MRMFYVILALMLAMDLAWWRYADGLLRPLRRARLWRGLLASFMGGQLFLLLWTVASRRFGPGFDQLTPQPLIAATYLWHLIVLPLLLLTCVVIGLLTMPWRLARWVRREHVVHPAHHITPGEAGAVAADLALEPAETSIAPSRRQFLGAALAATPPVLTAGAVAYALPSLANFRVRNFNVPVPGLPHALDGVTIAHVTDIHVGRFTDGPQLRKIIDATNNLRADLVLMTGDLINNSLADLPGSLDAVNRIDARAGVYLCEGNHDLFDSPSEFRRRVKAAGVPLLVNETWMINVRGYPVQLLGLPWGLGGMQRDARGADDALALTVPRLLALREPEAFPILLAHHPHAFDIAARENIPLTFAGHTHGGQLMLTPNFGCGPMLYRYWSGLYSRDRSSLVVSNGVGNWFPIRVNAPAEIVHVTLRRV